MPVTPVTLSNGKEKRIVKVKHPEGATKEQIHAYALRSVKDTPESPPIAPPEPSPDAPGNYKWSEVPGAALANLPESAERFGGGMVYAATHPVETGKTVGKLGMGAAIHADPNVALALTALGVDPATIASAVEIASAAGGVYKQRYGSVDALKRTLAEDPVGSSADISSILSLGASLPGRVGTAAALSSRLTNPMTPAAAVARVPFKAAAKMGGAVKNALNPKYATYLTAMEGRGASILNHLRDPGQVIVPGSVPTAAQAASPAGSTRFSALGKEAADTILPTEYLERRASQDAALLSAVRSVGRDKSALTAARSARTSKSGRFYKIADKQVIPGDSVLQSLLDTPSGKAALSKALRVAGDRRDRIMSGSWTPASVSPPVPNPLIPGTMIPGKPIPGTVPKFTGKGLHDIKLALDDVINDPATHGIGLSEVNAARAVRGEFLTWLEDKSRAYRAARTTHKKMSEPVNQMEVGQYLEQKLTNALAPDSLDLNPSLFGNAMRDAPGTIEKATGGAARFEKLEDVLTPNQMKLVEGVRDDLARRIKTDQMGKKGASAEPNLKNAGGSVVNLEPPHVLIRTITILSDMLRRLKGQVNERVALEIATEMLDPQTAATVIEKVLAREARYKAVTDPVLKTGRVINKAVSDPAAGVVNNALIGSREREENANAYRR